MKESAIQRSIIDFLKMLEQQHQRNLYWFRAGSGAMKTMHGRYFKTGRPGVPDLIVVLDGRFIGLEVKTATGRQSQAQKQAEQQIKTAGGEYHLVRCIDDVKKALFDIDVDLEK